MSAADSTSPKQFGWIEDTTVTHTPAKNEFSPSSTVGLSSMTRVDLGAARHAEGSGGSQYTFAPQEARVTANWSSVSSHLFSDDDIEQGRHWDRLPESGSWSGYTSMGGQGKLFQPGRESPPKVDFMESTARSRFSTMGGLGAVVNNVEALTGQVPKPSTDLSPHSAPLVSRMTGKEHSVTNDMEFVEPEDREEMEVPQRDVLGEQTTRPSYASGVTQTTTHTERMVPEAEIDAGKKRLVGHMKSMKQPKVTPDPNTYQQGMLDFTPEGPSARSYDAELRRGHMKNMLEARRMRRQGQRLGDEDLM